MQKKKPKILREIKDVSHYEKLGINSKNFLGGNKKKKDPITEIAKKANKSPKKMYKESMKHLHSLLDKK